MNQEMSRPSHPLDSAALLRSLAFPPNNDPSFYNSQILLKRSLAPFYTENSFRPRNSSYGEDFPPFPILPNLNKSNLLNLTQRTDWAEKEELDLQDSNRIKQAVDLFEAKRARSAPYKEEPAKQGPENLYLLHSISNDKDPDPTLKYESSLHQSSKKIKKARLNLSPEPRGPILEMDSPRSTQIDFPRKLSNKHRNKRNPWKPSEDAKLLELVDMYGECWAMISSKMVDRTGKQIRDRYLNILRPNLKKSEWTANEDTLFVSLYYHFGHKWSSIAKYMPGRSEAQVKNRYYSHLRKRISKIPREQRIPSFFLQEAGRLENEESINEASFEEEMHETENIKAEGDEQCVKVEFSGSGSEIGDVKVESETPRSSVPMHAVKCWDQRELKRLENQRRFYAEAFEEGQQGEYAKKYQEIMLHMQAQQEMRKGVPINEMEVDKVLEILARYYQQEGKKSLEECCEERINQGKMDLGNRLMQLDTRKAQLEFLLNKTMQEMRDIQQVSQGIKTSEF